MNKVISSFVLICLGSSSFHAYAQGFKPAPADKAVVYFGRASSFGFIAEFTYFDSNRVIGRFNSKNYLRYECTPGEHLFWALADNKEFITADLEAGKAYLVDVVPNMGAFQAAVKLLPVDPKDSKRVEKLEKLIEEKASKDMTAEERERATTNLANTITKALEKYGEDAAKGKKFKRIDKTMAYEKK